MKYFYQDFLFEEMPLDQNDQPVVPMKIITEEKIPLPICGPYPSEPYLTVTFSYLQKLYTEQDWRAFLQECSNNSKVYLLDNFPLAN